LDPKPAHTAAHHTNSVPAVHVDPATVDCGTQTSSESGESIPCPEVTVTSTGDAPLRVTNIEWQPTGFFAHDQDCVRRSPLAKGESCTIRISMRPDGDPGQRSAQMIVHENVKTDNGVRVSVNGDLEAPQPVGDLVISPDSVSCASAGNDVEVTFTVGADAASSATQPTEVTVSAHDVTETSTQKLPDVEGVFPVGQPGPLPIPLSHATLGQPSVVLALEAEPDGDPLTIKSTLPDQSHPEGPLTCS